MFHNAKMGIAPVAGLVGAMGLGACANEPAEPTFGERVAAEGGNVTAIAERWTGGEAMIAEGRDLVDEGEENVDDGEELVDEGENLIKTGRREIRRGEELIAGGQRMQRDAEASYRQRQATNVTF